MNWKKLVVDTLTIIAFLVGAQLSVTISGISHYLLIISLVYALQWSFTRNVAYGRRLERKAPDGTDV